MAENAYETKTSRPVPFPNGYITSHLSKDRILAVHGGSLASDGDKVASHYVGHIVSDRSHRMREGDA